MAVRKARFLLLITLVLLCAAPALGEEETTMRTYTNPIAARGADPDLVQFEDTYYYCYSQGYALVVARVDDPTRLDDYDAATGAVVYVAPEDTAYSYEYWAPELHRIDGAWYIYVAADDGQNETHRMYVLKCTGDVPTEDFEMVGKVADPSDKWAIDGTVFQYGGKLYMVWSGWAGDVNVQQNLYIAPMSDPCAISGERVMISYPAKDWETRYYPINEGPAVLVKDRTVQLVYSASASWKDDYCLGLLTYRPENGDILDASSWVKSDGPVFEKQPGSYGPGHCSFIQSPDHTEDYIVYHANIVSGTGWNGRSVRMQKFTWDGDVPVFGQPVDVGVALPLPSGTVRQAD